MAYLLMMRNTRLG